MGASPSRRVARALMHGRPHPDHDLMVTRLPGADRVYVGIVGAGFVRLTPTRARQLADELTTLVDAEPVAS